MNFENSERLCKRCGGRLHRKHRRWWQKPVYRSVYTCDTCGAHEGHRRGIVRRYLSTRCRCPRCWSEQLKVFGKRDHVEFFKKSVLRRIQSWFGAPLYYCERCRLQFYDARPRRRVEVSREDVGTGEPDPLSD